MESPIYKLKPSTTSIFKFNDEGVVLFWWVQFDSEGWFKAMF